MELRRVNPQHHPTTAAENLPVTPEVLRQQYESGATVDELVAASGLSYGTVLNRLHEAGTVMRTSWQTRRMRQDPQARQRLAARLRTLYEQHGATLTELAAAAGGTRRAARRLVIEAGGTVRTPQQTLRMRAAARAVERQKLALSLRARYEAGVSVPDLAEESNYSVATVYRLLHAANTPMRPQHSHGPARTSGKRSPAQT
jgi:transcriptional regulator with XRE-family HTH domain